MSEIWIPLLSAFVGALFGGAVSFVLQRQRIKHEQAQLREADKTTFAAEDTVRRMLKHGGYTERTLGAIRDKVGGYDNDLDELRRILLRAGATRVKLGSNEQGFLDEKWRLQERDAEYVAKKIGGVSK